MSYDFDLTEVEFRLLRDFIHERYGIYLKEEKRAFVRMKLYNRVASRGFSSFGAYLKSVKEGEEKDSELARVIGLLTNNETYFFREEAQLRTFQDEVLEEIKKEKLDSGGERSLRVLSAGCSTGEEAYTIAMLIYASGAFFWNWDVQVVGIDVSQRALEAAQKGLYSERSFRSARPEIKDKFFKKNGDLYRVEEKIKKNVTFEPANLLDGKAWERLGRFDAIFCRNVLIYFSEEKISRVLDYFHEALGEGGRLLLGHSESLGAMVTDFAADRRPQTILYRKAPG